MCFKRQNHFNLFWFDFQYIKMLPLCHIQISPNNKSIHITRTRVYAQRGPNRIGNTNSREEKKRTTHTNTYKTNAKQKGLKIVFLRLCVRVTANKIYWFFVCPSVFSKNSLNCTDFHNAGACWMFRCLVYFAFIFGKRLTSLKKCKQIIYFA